MESETYIVDNEWEARGSLTDISRVGATSQLS